MRRDPGRIKRPRLGRYQTRRQCPIALTPSVEAALVKDAGRKSRPRIAQVVWTVHCVVDPRQLPNCAIANEYTTAGITHRQVRLIRSAVAIERGFQQITDMQSSRAGHDLVTVFDALHAVLPPTFYGVRDSPAPSLELRARQAADRESIAALGAPAINHQPL